MATAGHRASFEGLCRALELHRIRPVVGNVYSISDWREAFEQMSKGRHFGKIVIDLTQSLR